MVNYGHHRYMLYSKNGQKLYGRDYEWTDAQDAQLEEMRMGGMKVKEIADELGRSYASVLMRLKELDLIGGA